jgi:hypothetical protein
MTVERDPFVGPWFDSKTAAAYIPCKTLKGFYEWCRRHHIVRRANGSVAKADIDRALKAKRRPRRIHPNTLANLRKRHARSVAPPVQPVTRESLEGSSC